MWCQKQDSLQYLKSMCLEGKAPMCLMDMVLSEYFSDICVVMHTNFDNILCFS